MKKLHILQLGAGNVGRALIRQISQSTTKEFVYCGIFTSKGGVFNKHGLSKKDLASLNVSSTMVIDEVLTQMPQPFVLVDTTASDITLGSLKTALKLGGFVVMSNKKPIAGTQKDFDTLHKLGGRQLFYETTVGAGLPVISTLKTLLATADEVVEIQGCFSGTLGFLFSQIEQGVSFSAAVLKAKKLGFTEPDPRDDLSGIDVARKALILARIIGLKLEMTDIKLKGLYPKSMEKLTVESFMDQLSTLDKSYEEKATNAKKENKVLRFVATVSQKGCTVGLEAIDRFSDIGNLSGPDNLIVFKTKRYYDNPLIIKGPGAGAEVTAAGVYGDIAVIGSRLSIVC